MLLANPTPFCCPGLPAAVLLLHRSTSGVLRLKGLMAWSGSSTAAQVRVLVEEGGASFDVRDGYSMDPLDEAMRHRHEDIAALLQSCGALIGGRAPL